MEEFHLRRARSKHRLAFCILALLPAACGDGAEEPAPSPPSVILISLDTLRAGHTSVYGYERDTTPYLERLAGECLVFDQAHSVAPWTLISHVTMLTGLYPEQHGVISEDVALSPRIPFLAQRLREHGYRTIGLYKPGFIGHRYGHDRGFDVFLSHEEAWEAGRNLEETLPLIDEGEPLFLFLHLFDIHSDPLFDRTDLFYDPPPPFDRLFLPDAKDRLAGVDFREVRKVRANQQEGQRLSPSQVEALIALYDGKIRHVDSVLEDWIEGWRRDGLLDNCLLIITSDHGESLAQRDGQISGHGGVWQDALHIPLMVRFPDGHRAGQREDRLVSLVDVVPTVLDALRLPPDPRLPGQALNTELPEDRVVGAFRPPMRARIRWPWKLTGKGHKGWLYNLEQDPLELNGMRAGEPQFEQIADELHQAYGAELEGRPFADARPIEAIEPESEDMLQQLEALGYVGGDQ